MSFALTRGGGGWLTLELAEAAVELGAARLEELGDGLAGVGGLEEVLLDRRHDLSQGAVAHHHPHVRSRDGGGRGGGGVVAG